MDIIGPILLITLPPIGFAIGLWAMVRWQDRLIFHPFREAFPVPPEILAHREEIRLITEDEVSLSAWFFPPPDPEAPVIVYFHGNTGNLTTAAETIRHLLTLDAGILALDYRGYGLSEGAPSEEGLARDARAAWSWLIEEKSIPPQRIVLYGRSLGAAVAIRLAAETATNARAVIMESGFSDIVTLAEQFYPLFPRQCARFSFPSIDYVGKRQMPLLVAHSNGETYIPVEHARTLLAAAQAPCHFFALQGGHARGWMDSWPTYGQAFREFIYHPTNYRRSN